MKRIVVLGDLNLDVYAAHPEGLAVASEARASVRTAPGGSAGTFARAAAAAGAAVTFVGSVGDDLVGDLLVRSLEEKGIVALVRRDSRPTGTILALERGGERTMVCSRGANDGLSAEAVRARTFDGADHLHISGYALLSPAQREAARRAIALAADRKATISVDPPPANLIRAFGTDAFFAELACVTWLFPNHSEGRLLAGTEKPEAIADGLAREFPVGAVTLGADGALAWRGAERSLARPPRAVAGNPTGAGDAYAAGFVVAILDGAALAEANGRGCATAAEHVRRANLPGR